MGLVLATAKRCACWLLLDSGWCCRSLDVVRCSFSVSSNVPCPRRHQHGRLPAGHQRPGHQIRGEHHDEWHMQGRVCLCHALLPGWADKWRMVHVSVWLASGSHTSLLNPCRWPRPTTWTWAAPSLVRVCHGQLGCVRAPKTLSGYCSWTVISVTSAHQLTMCCLDVLQAPPLSPSRLGWTPRSSPLASAFRAPFLLPCASPVCATRSR